MKNSNQPIHLQFSLLLIIFFSSKIFASNSFEESKLERLKKEKSHFELFHYVYSANDPINQEKDYQSVTREFGKSKILKSELDGKIHSFESNTKPWSSWWYPTFEKTLFEVDGSSTNSPLGKYDRYYYKRFRRTIDSATYEKEKIYNPRAVDWDGLCYPWSIASILYKEPTEPVTRYGITFEVSDQKALLLKVHEEMEGIKMYGNRFNGQWDDIHSDIYPEEFHRFVQYWLVERKKTFVIDTDPSFQVWNVPVYKVQYKLTHEPETNSIKAKMWVFTASPHVEDKNYVGTLEVIHTYTYRLYIERDVNDAYIIKNGEWIDRSLWDHPDYLLLIPSVVKHSSRNPLVKANYIEDIIGL